jgi:hypothetical protein
VAKAHALKPRVMNGAPLSGSYLGPHWFIRSNKTVYQKMQKTC